MRGHPPDIPSRATVRIEVPRGSFARRGPGGELEFLSPLPCPFNYGSVPAWGAPDGDPADAVVPGPRLPRGWTGELALVGRVRFVDGGLADDKWVFGREPDAGDLRALRLFFRLYALAKRQRDRLPGRRGPSRFLGIDLFEGA